MSIDRDDPRLTAYALGEMTPAETLAFDVELAGDDEARAEVAAIREMGTQVKIAFTPAGEPRLTTAQRETILVHASQPRVRRLWPALIRTAQLAAAAAAVAALGIVVWPLIHPPAPTVVAHDRDPEPEIEVGAHQANTALVTTPSLPAATYSLEPAPEIDLLAGNQDLSSPNVPRISGTVADPDPLDVDLTIPRQPAPLPFTLPDPNHQLIEHRLDLNMPPYLSPVAFDTGPDGLDRGTIVQFPDRPRDNSFADAFLAPISRLPASADTASWAYARQMLSAGDLPHQRGIRLEGFINYAKYDYPAPTSDAVAALSIGSDAYECPWNPARRLVRLTLTARSESSNQPVPDLVLLMDLSGSMQRAGRLPLFRGTFNRLYRNGSGKRNVAIVTTTPERTRYLVLGGADQQSAVMAAVAGLQQLPEKATGQSPLELACRLARTMHNPGKELRIVIVTDTTIRALAKATTDLAELLGETQQHGISIQALTFGAVAGSDVKTDGVTTIPVSDSKTALAAVAQVIGIPWHPVADATDIRVEFNPSQVTAYRLLGYEDGSLQARSPDVASSQVLGTGESLTFLYEVVPAQATPTWVRRGALKYQRLVTATEPFQSETLTWTVAFRQPDGSRKSVDDVLVDLHRPFEHAPDDFRLAAAIAELGLLMRQSPYRGSASLDHIQEVVERVQVADSQACKELIEMVRAYRRLAPKSADR